MSDQPKPLKTKPPKAKPEDPHWLVKAVGKHGPAHASGKTFFLHPTEELADGEAERLANLHPGRRFAVYASGKSFKVPKPAVEAEPSAKESTDEG